MITVPPIALPAHARVSGAAGKVLVDQDQVRRTVARIAHEIVERHAEPDRLALVGIHTRGVPLAAPPRRPDRRVRRAPSPPSAPWTSRSTATTSGSTPAAAPCRWWATRCSTSTSPSAP